MRQTLFAVLITLTVVSVGAEFSLTQFAHAANARDNLLKQEEIERRSDKMDRAKCIEYCAVVKQSCEGLATIQPIQAIAQIGSKENSEWSKQCYKINHDCREKCSGDKKKVRWKKGIKHMPWDD